MVKKIILAIIVFLFSSSTALADGEILVVQSARIPPYEDALNGFLSTSNYKIRRNILSESKTPGLKEDLKKTGIHLILAIGQDALMSVREIRDIPVVYIMVLNPQSILIHDENFYGVCMSILPDKQLEIFSKAIPGLNNIGLIYNPKNTGVFTEKAVMAAEKNGIHLITGKVSKAPDVPSIIRGMSDKIDAFWMIPDITLMTPEAIDLLLITSIEKKIPILTFSDKYVEMGALLSIAVDPYDMGKQAGETAKKVLDQNLKEAENKIFAEKEIITLNRKIAKKLGIDLKIKMDSAGDIFK